jgi:hypothetical protein
MLTAAAFGLLGGLTVALGRNPPSAQDLPVVGGADFVSFMNEGGRSDPMGRPAAFSRKDGREAVIATALRRFSDRRSDHRAL